MVKLLTDNTKAESEIGISIISNCLKPNRDRYITQNANNF